MGLQRGKQRAKSTRISIQDPGPPGPLALARPLAAERYRRCDRRAAAGSSARCRPDARRLKHLREQPDKVSFHFASDGHGQDIFVLHGQVVVNDDHPVIQDWPLSSRSMALPWNGSSAASRSSARAIRAALRVTITGVRGLYVQG